MINTRVRWLFNETKMIGYVVTGQENDEAVSYLFLSVEKHHIADPIQFKINLFRKFGLSRASLLSCKCTRNFRLLLI